MPKPPIHTRSVLASLFLFNTGDVVYNENRPGVFITYKNGNPRHLECRKPSVVKVPMREYKEPRELDEKLLKLFTAASKHMGKYKLVSTWDKVPPDIGCCVGNFLVVPKAEFVGRLCWDGKDGYGAAILNPLDIEVFRVRSQIPQILREIKACHQRALRRKALLLDV